MALHKNRLLDGLLRYNYLPTQKKKKQEIPPFFSSKDLSPEVAKKLQNISPSEARRSIGGYDVIEFDATRFNNVSRSLSIPHPKAYSDLCLSIHENWGKLSQICENNNSLIWPMNHEDGRVVIMDYEQQWQSRNRILRSAFGKKFRVKTDISSFYPTIYSHAISWALVGIGEAKKKSGPKFKSEWFNKLDAFQRYCKRNETAGIPIGPATSNIISEVILAKIDQELGNHFEYVRYIDDYICYCSTYEEAEEFIRKLATELKKFKMSLHVGKTKIEKLPIPTNELWVGEVKKLIPKEKNISSNRACDILDSALSLQTSVPSGSVLKYISQCIVDKVLGLDALQFSMYLLKLCMHYPILIPLLDKPLSEAYSNTLINIQSVSYEEQLKTLLDEAIKNKQSDSMCWLLFYFKKFHSNIEQGFIDKIIGTKDSLAITSLLIFGEDGKNAAKAFAENLNVDDLYQLDNYWMLLYQLFKLDEVKNPYKDDKTFKILKENNIDFLGGDYE